MSPTSRGFSSPFNEETKSSGATGSTYPNGEKTERSWQQLLPCSDFPFPSLFLIFSPCGPVTHVTDMQVSYSFMSYKKNATFRAFWTLLDHRVLALKGSLEIILFRPL